jgi:hypothetical protein
MENLTREFDALNSRGSCVGELSFVRIQNVVAACDMKQVFWQKETPSSPKQRPLAEVRGSVCLALYRS